MLAMLAPSSVLFALDDRRATACRNRAPAHVVHRSYRILNAELLVLFHHFAIQVQVLDVQVVEILKAVGVRALQLANLAFIDLRSDHFIDALSAIVVFAACQELEFVAEELACADATLLLFTIELSSESLIGNLETLF